MSKFADRIREAIFNLERTPGHRNDEEYDPRISTPVQEAIDLLKDLMREKLTLKATPEQISNLQKLMEGGLGEYQCMPLEEFDKLQTPEELQAFKERLNRLNEPTKEDVDKLVKEIMEDGPAMKALKQGTPVFGGAARVNVPVEEEVYKPQAIPELKYQVQGAKPGTRILVGNQQEPESHQQEQQPREQRHCTAHTTYAPETAIPERTPEQSPEEIPHYPV